MTDLRTALAIALMQHRYRKAGVLLDWDMTPESHKTAYLSQADAALAVLPGLLRDPIIEVLQEGIWQKVIMGDGYPSMMQRPEEELADMILNLLTEGTTT